VEDSPLSTDMSMSYTEAIRIAEERERQVKGVFEKYDVDNSNSIDMEELLALLDDLGLVNKLKSEPKEFATTMFVKYDTNDDGVLSFEEFKGLYNAAIDDVAGKKKPTNVAAKTSSGLDGGTNAMRQKLKQEKAAKKAEEAERIRKQNADMKARVMAQGQGRDTKALDQEVENARKQMAEARAKAKADEKAKIDEENRAFAAKKGMVKAATSHSLTADEQAMRDAAAAKSAADKEAEKRRLADENRQKSERIMATGAATVNSLSADELAMREAAAAKSASDKAALESKLAEENRQMRGRVAGAGPAIDDKLS